MKQIAVVQIGVGGVGRALIEQVLEGNGHWAEREGFAFTYLALADSQGLQRGTPQLDAATLRRVLAAKAQGQALPVMAATTDLLACLPQQPALVVDVTGTDATLPTLITAAERGHKVVLANKKPLAGKRASFHTLVKHGARYEATVGAGLPVISTLHALLDTGDEVEEIAGCFSGTLGYVFSELERGTPFSTAVLTAKARGWTEPDPRDDLSGMDVARKALILARTLGYQVMLDDLEIEPLFTAAHRNLDLNQFLAALPELDRPLADRMAAAQAHAKTLRYVAVVGRNGPSVGIRAVPQQSPLGGLQGPDNLVSFTTTRYQEYPLVIRGPGAGTERTAAGVLSDMLTLARQLP